MNLFPIKYKMISDCRRTAINCYHLSLPHTHSMKLYMIRYLQLHGRAQFSTPFLLTAWSLVRTLHTEVH